MKFASIFPRHARSGATVRDRSLAAILFLLMALVFAPIIGLHVALAAFPDEARGSASVSKVPAGNSAALSGRS